MRGFPWRHFPRSNLAKGETSRIPGSPCIPASWFPRVMGVVGSASGSYLQHGVPGAGPVPRLAIPQACARENNFRQAHVRSTTTSSPRRKVVHPTSFPLAQTSLKVSLPCTRTRACNCPLQTSNPNRQLKDICFSNFHSPLA